MAQRSGIAKNAAMGNIMEGLNDSIFYINVMGVLFTIQKALPLRQAAGQPIALGSDG